MEEGEERAAWQWLQYYTGGQRSLMQKLTDEQGLEVNEGRRNICIQEEPAGAKALR